MVPVFSGPPSNCETKPQLYQEFVAAADKYADAVQLANSMVGKVGFDSAMRLAQFARYMLDQRRSEFEEHSAEHGC